jgi:hypothetical protein
VMERTFVERLANGLFRPGACANDLAGIARDRGFLPFEGVRS